MAKLLSMLLTLCVATLSLNAKTLVVYYSYTNNVERIVNELKTQIDCDVVEIQPAEKGLDYAANNYAIGSAQIAAIRNNPDDASSYPAIDPVEVNLDEYETVIIGAPLWWSQMAAPLQTYLFHNGAKMAGKNIGMIVSSHSSGISGVVADAKRLIPEGKFIEPNLWIRSAETGNCRALISEWLEDIHYNDLGSAVTSITTDHEFEIVAENGQLTVNGEFHTLSLYSLSGNKIMNTTDKHVSTSALAPGIYIALASNGHRTVMSKISIK